MTSGAPEAAPERTPGIRGEERHALVEDLALAELTQAEIAMKYGRAHITIKQFRARNAAEIAGRRRVLQGELATATDHLWIADKVTRIAWCQKLCEDLDSYLADPDLDLRVRHRYTREVASILHQASELLGELPTRSTIEVESGSVLRHEVVGFSPDKWLEELAANRADTTATHAPPPMQSGVPERFAGRAKQP